MDMNTTQPPSTSPSGSLRDVFWPRPGYVATPILMGINILVFVGMVLTGVNIMSPTGQDLVNWGANYTPLTYGGQPWRLLTACFLHIGLIHIVVNMMSLRVLGSQIEPLLGTSRFAVGYVVTGLTGSLVSLWWHDMVVSAGASGAIFGIEGMLVGLLLTNLFDAAARKALLKNSLSVVGINLLIGAGIGADNAAHLGGFLGGLLVGLSYYYVIRAELGWPAPRLLARNAVAFGLSALVVVVLALFVFSRSPL
ncbi:Rhomboid protease gluP [Fibrella aestuarina BUZ 2]|uniref:Rhomboid protease gluP n=2 Tax=Fibrella TaxID=861914 RepID=I0KFA8_9BACT|nr:Rhomboid protease gluP [Fibrella aestuarina BUZ 2]